MTLKELKRKIDLFVKRYGYYWFYYNHNRYRSKGVYPTVYDFVNHSGKKDEIYFEVFPEKISEMKLTEEMLQISSEYVHYDLKFNEPPKFILKIKNGRILSDLIWTVAVFDEEDKLIGDVSLDLFKKGQSIENSRILKRKYYPEVKHFKGTVFPTIGGGGTNMNYAHWLVDSFSRIHILKESGLFDQVDWFYVPTLKHDYQRDTFREIGIPQEKIIESTRYPHIKSDYILSSNYPRGNYYHLPFWVIEFYSKNFFVKNKPKYLSKKYFISRKDSGFRNISNEDEIVEFLKAYDVETVVLSELSFQEKIDLFAYADLIISLWGAGLANFLFCKEGTNVVEIFGDQHIDFTLYFDIAMKKNLNYHYLIGKNCSKVNNWHAGQRSDVYINTDDLKKLLEDKLVNLS